MPAVAHPFLVVYHVCSGRPNALRLARHDVTANHVPALRLRVDNPRISEVRHRDEAVAPTHLVPVVVGDPDVLACRTRAAPAVVVLHAATDIERALHVVVHMVEEPDREVRQKAPGATGVPGDGEPSVVPDQDMIRISRVDPDGVHVVVRETRRVRREGLTPIDGQVQSDTAHVHPIRVGGIDANLAEVHRPRIRVAHELPGGASVLRAIQTVEVLDLFLVTLRGVTAVARKARTLDQGIHDLIIKAVYIDFDAAEWAIRQTTTGHPEPVVPAIRRLPDPAARPSTIHAACVAATLVGRRIQRIQVGP